MPADPKCPECGSRDVVSQRGYHSDQETGSTEYFLNIGCGNCGQQWQEMTGEFDA